MGIFGLEFEKAIVISIPSNLSDCKVWCKIKILKFGTKLAYFWEEFENIIVMFEINVLEFVLLQIFAAKFGVNIEILKFGTKNVLFLYFWAEIWKNCCHIRNQHPQIFLIANFGTKIYVFLGWNLKTSLSYLKSAPSNLSNCKISRKIQNFEKRQKCLSLGPKMPYLNIFDQKCRIWIFLG